MKKAVCITCLATLFLFTFAGSVAVAQHTQFSQTEEAGREVTEAISSAVQFDISTFQNYNALKSALDELACEGVTHGYYRIGDLVYAIGTSREGVVMGRNLKFNVVASYADIDSISPSTDACLVIPNHPNSLGLTVTHRLSDTPTEFHVIANLVSGKTVYVGTKTGFWEVTDGKISLIKTRDIYVPPSANE